MSSCIGLLRIRCWSVKSTAFGLLDVTLGRRKCLLLARKKEKKKLSSLPHSHTELLRSTTTPIPHLSASLLHHDRPPLLLSMSTAPRLRACCGFPVRLPACTSTSFPLILAGLLRALSRLTLRRAGAPPSAFLAPAVEFNSLSGAGDAITLAAAAVVAGGGHA